MFEGFFPNLFFFFKNRNGKSCSMTLQGCNNGSLPGSAVGVKDDGEIRHSA